jgi:hypothetical protein
MSLSGKCRDLASLLSRYMISHRFVMFLSIFHNFLFTLANIHDAKTKIQCRFHFIGCLGKGRHNTCIHSGRYLRCALLPKRANPTPCLHPLVYASPTTTRDPSQPTPTSPPPCQKPITPTPDTMQWLLAIHLLTLARQHSNAEQPFSHTMWSLLI